MDTPMYKSEITPLFVCMFLAVFIASLPGFTMARDSGFVSRVEISGNNRLADGAILNMCPIDLERSFIRSELEALLVCLVDTDEFDSVDLDIHANRLKISVLEKTPNKGKLSIGVSVSSNRGPAVQLEATKPTLFNRSLAGKMRLRYSKESTDANVALKSNQFFGTSHKGKVELSFIKNAFEELPYDDKQTRLAASFEFPVGKNSEVVIQAGIQKSSMYNADPTASPIIVGELGNFTNGFVGISYSLQSDPQLNVRSHYKAKISQTLFFGNQTIKYGQTRLEASSNTRIFDEHRIKVAFTGGAIVPFSGTTTRAVDRFSLGGHSFRGFAPRGLGPVDGTTYLGGNYYAVATIETRSPIASWNEVALEGGVFASIGSVWGLNNTLGGVGTVDDSSSAHTSIGASFIINASSIPIHFYYAVPIKKKQSAKQQEFGFYISSSF